MLGTYVSLALILGASLVVGQAIFSACGHRAHSPLAPAVGLGLNCAVAWGAANLAGSAWAGLAALALLAIIGTVVVRFKPAQGEIDGAVAAVLGAVLLGSLPFIVEMRFGILGTSLNPDMSQHLFATDRLSTGGEERLITEGYPLGPHALVASVAKLGPSTVHAFGGLTLAIAVAATLAALGALGRLARPRRIGAALLVGAAYLAASYLIQGAFKETMQALFMLAFAVGLARLAKNRNSRGRDASEADRVQLASDRWERRKAVPLAVLAIGSIYAYSFPGLAWLVGTLALWAIAEIVRARGLGVLRRAGAPGAIGVLVLLLGAAPEVPRMLDFASFETFDPDGAGLGNLFNPISPIEALGIWPSGDFRLDPGAGFAPSLAFYLGGAVGALALGYGLIRSLRSGETALAAAVLAGAALYLYALLRGTPYQEAKALGVVAPVAMLVAVRACLEATPPVHSLRNAPTRRVVLPALALVFLAGAAGSSVLALVNGPVGPASWTPALLDFSAKLADKPVLAIVDDGLAEENGRDLVTWELRGREVCVVSVSEVEPETVSDRAFEAVVVIGELEEPLPVVGRLAESDRAVSGGLDYTLYEGKLAGADPDCPFVADGDRAEPVS
ncbi:MAG: hypothetical protein M3331_02355 [Actinomycetota bacterium]|nr:hypothetical protein [Actinomycetota bacterium]